MSDETHWIDKARAGERTAFKHLYDHHVDSLFRFLRQFSRQEEETEEWVQRAFIKAFRHLDSFDGRSKFGSWLFRIGINEMKNDRRKHQDNIISLRPEDLPDSPADEEDFVWQSTMYSLLAELGDTQRMVFTLFEVEGYSHAEISNMLDIAESSSRSLLTRAKHHLRRKWIAEDKQT